MFCEPAISASADPDDIAGIDARNAVPGRSLPARMPVLAASLAVGATRDSEVIDPGEDARETIWRYRSAFACEELNPLGRDIGIVDLARHLLDRINATVISRVN